MANVNIDDKYDGNTEFDKICNTTRQCATISSDKHYPNIIGIIDRVKKLNNKYNCKLIESPIHYDLTNDPKTTVKLQQQLRDALLNLINNLPLELINIIVEYTINTDLYLLLLPSRSFLKDEIYKQIKINLKHGNNNHNSNEENKYENDDNGILTSDYRKLLVFRPNAGQNPLPGYVAYIMRYLDSSYRYNITYQLLIKSHSKGYDYTFFPIYLDIDLYHIALFTGYTIEIFDINNRDSNNNIHSKLTLITPVSDCYKTKAIEKVRLIYNNNGGVNQLLVIMNDIVVLIYDLNNGQLINEIKLDYEGMSSGCYCLAPNNELLFIVEKKLYCLNIITNHYNTYPIPFTFMIYDLAVLNNDYYCIYTTFQRFPKDPVIIYVYSLKTHTPVVKINAKPTYIPSLFFPNYKSFIHTYYNNSNNNTNRDSTNDSNSTNNNANNSVNKNESFEYTELSDYNNNNNENNNYIMMDVDNNNDRVIFTNLFTGQIVKILYFTRNIIINRNGSKPTSVKYRINSINQ